MANIGHLREPGEVLNYLKNEWTKIRNVENSEKKQEVVKIKLGIEEQNCVKEMNRVADNFTEKIGEYENKLTHNPQDMNGLGIIRRRMLELLSQYQYYHRTLNKLLSEDRKVSSIEEWDFQQIATQMSNIEKGSTLL